VKRPIAVRTLTLVQFGVYRDVTVELPSTGVVAITGRNGSGKSTIIDAVSWCAYGRVYRGAQRTVPPNDEATVSLELNDGTIVERVRSKRRASATITVDSITHAFDTVTQFDTFAEQLLQPFDTWSRSNVFCSSDAQRFATATDVQRKELIESALAVDSVDAAYTKARELYLSAMKRRDAVAYELSGVRRAIEHERTVSAQEHETIISNATAELNLALERVLVLKREGAAALAVQRELQSKVNATLDALSAANAARTVALREHELTCAGKCYVCGQRIEADAAMAANELARCEELFSQRAAEHAKAREELDRASSTTERYRVSVRAAQASAAQLESSIERATQFIAAPVIPSASLIAPLEVQLAELERELLRRDVACTVLGPKGARSLLLRDALLFLQQRTNEMLSELGAAYTIELRPVTGDGAKQRASIELRVVGIGGGVYSDCSGGERRRIDVAIAIALGELSSWSTVRSDTSTLFLDEVFDALDSDARKAASAWIELESQRRCVVVVTHSEEFLSGLPDALVLHSHNGGLNRGKH